MFSFFKSTLCLALLNIVLWLGIYYLQSSHTQNQAQVLHPALGLPISSITAITLEPKEGQSKNFQYQDSVWHIAQPITWRANSYAIQYLLGQLQLLSGEAVLSVDQIHKSGQTLADFGLSEPKLWIRIWDHNNKEFKLGIGQATHIGNKLYILSYDQQSIYVAPASLLDTLNWPIQEWYAPSIFDLPQHAIKNITLKLDATNRTIILSKEKEQWNIEAPLQTRANSPLVESTLSALLNLEPHFDLTTEPTIDWFMRLTLTSHLKHETLRIGHGSSPDSSTLFAKLESSPTLFTIDAALFTDLQNAQDYLRDRHVLRFNVNEITTAEISMDGHAVRLQKLETGRWNVLSTHNNSIITYAADNHIIHNLFESLSHLEAEQFLNDTPSQADKDHYGLTAPQRLVTLQTPDHTYTLAIGNLDSQSQLLYASSKHEPSIVGLNTSCLSWISISPLHYLDRVLYNKPENAQVESFTLRRLADDTTCLNYVLPTPEATWPEVFANEQLGRQQTLLEWIQALEAFEVDSYLTDTFSTAGYTMDNAIIPWSYQLEVTYRLPSSSTDQHLTHTYYFTHRLGGNLQIGGSPTVSRTFRLTQSMMDTLFAFTFKLTPPPIIEPSTEPQPNTTL